MSLPLESCTKMYDTGMISEEVFGRENLFQMGWYLASCTECERNAGICSRKIGTKDEIDCIDKLDSGSVIGSLILILAITTINPVYSSMKMEKENQIRIKKFLEDYKAMIPTRYSYGDIKKITNNFRDKLGEGAYGIAFKGKISDEIYVAVKLLRDSKANGEEFINEVATMGRIHHINVVRLIGFSADGFRRALIYEFMPHCSLDRFIFSNGKPKNALKLEKLQEIALGIARGIEYLHQGCEQRILYLDIKPHNILLDHNFTAKISDFGLSKLYEKGRSALVSVTAARGTMGYMAPEVYSSQFGRVSYESDIYSFGILLLEMVGHKVDERFQNIHQMNFLESLFGHMLNEEDLRFQVEDEEEGRIARKLAIVGLWCIQGNPDDRPSITFVLQMLEANGENLNLPPNPFTLDYPGNAVMYKRHLEESALEVISETERTAKLGTH